MNKLITKKYNNMNEFKQNEDTQNAATDIGQSDDASAETQFEASPQENTASIDSGVDQTESKSTGSIIAIIVIVVIIIIGGLYFWGQTVNDDTMGSKDTIAEEIASTPDATTEALKQQGGSDAISDIDADLNSTDFGDFDAELQEIDAQLNF